MDAALAQGLAGVISFILNLVQLLVIGSFIVSWVGDPSNQIVQMIQGVTEPMYRPIRKFTKRIPGPLDWAPLVVLMIIIFLDKSVVSYLQHYARGSM